MSNPDDQIAEEIAREMGLEVEYFVPLPKPHVRLFGAASNGGCRQLANVVELTASKYHYNVVVELPQVLLSENEIEWDVNAYSEVTIEGRITPGALFANRPITSNKRNRVQLCPTEPWAISFYLPTVVDWWTAAVYAPANNIIEISVVKRNPSAEPAVTGQSEVMDMMDESVI